jgi:hypothetical protein
MIRKPAKLGHEIYASGLLRAGNRKPFTLTRGEIPGATLWACSGDGHLLSRHGSTKSSRNWSVDRRPRRPDGARRPPARATLAGAP